MPVDEPAEALWRDAYGSALSRRLRSRCEATHAVALWPDARTGATLAEALARRLRDATPVEALWSDAC